MIHQFKVYIMTIKDGVIERFVNCTDNLSAIIIASAIYDGRVIDTEIIFWYNIVIKERKIKMTDRGKFIALVSYIKGSIGESKYVATLDVVDFNSFLNSIGEK